jgi:hypothetical protein
LRFTFRQVMIGSTWALALTWPVFVFAPTVFVLGVVTAVSFVAVPVQFVTQVSYRLSVIPDHLQGRVNAPFRLLSWGCQPLGLALAGALLQAFGPVATVWILFVPQVALAVAVSVNRAVRQN